MTVHALLLLLYAASLTAARDICRFVDGGGVGERDELLTGTTWTEQACAQAVLDLTKWEKKYYNGARVHGEPGVRLCSAVYGMHSLVANINDDQQRSCYIYPTSEEKTLCRTVPAACTAEHDAPTLALASVQLVGSIPTELGLLEDTLEELDLSGNSLSGTLPTQLGRLTKLRVLAADQNGRLSGSVPSHLGQLTGLRYLALHGNRLSGALPTQLGRLAPPYCYLTDGQYPFELREELVAIRGGAEPEGSNHFDCPLPQLFAGCAMSGLGFAGRDAHEPGACEDPGGLTYHTRRVYTTDGETAGEHVTQPT